MPYIHRTWLAQVRQERPHQSSPPTYSQSATHHHVQHNLGLGCDQAFYDPHGHPPSYTTATQGRPSADSESALPSNQEGSSAFPDLSSSTFSTTSTITSTGTDSSSASYAEHRSTNDSSGEESSLADNDNGDQDGEARPRFTRGNIDTYLSFLDAALAAASVDLRAQKNKKHGHQAYKVPSTRSMIALIRAEEAVAAGTDDTNHAEPSMSPAQRPHKLQALGPVLVARWVEAKARLAEFLVRRSEYKRVRCEARQKRERECRKSAELRKRQKEAKWLPRNYNLQRLVETEVQKGVREQVGKVDRDNLRDAIYEILLDGEAWVARNGFRLGVGISIVEKRRAMLQTMDTTELVEWTFNRLKKSREALEEKKRVL